MRNWKCREEPEISRSEMSAPRQRLLVVPPQSLSPCAPRSAPAGRAPVLPRCLQGHVHGKKEGTWCRVHTVPGGLIRAASTEGSTARDSILEAETCGAVSQGTKEPPTEEEAGHLMSAPDAGRVTKAGCWVLGPTRNGRCARWPR